MPHILHFYLSPRSLCPAQILHGFAPLPASPLLFFPPLYFILHAVSQLFSALSYFASDYLALLYFSFGQVCFVPLLLPFLGFFPSALSTLPPPAPSPLLLSLSPPRFISPSIPFALIPGFVPLCSVLFCSILPRVFRRCVLASPSPLLPALPGFS